jgi:hypothetical protein
MEEDLLKKMEEQDKKLDEIFRSCEKTRKIFTWTLIITLALFVLPLIGLAIAIPQILNMYTGMMDIGI